MSSTRELWKSSHTKIMHRKVNFWTIIYILFHWCKKFKLERVSLGLNLYKKDDNPLMYRIIKSAESISISVVNNIFHIHLGVREMCCHLTPHYLIDAEK
jgi:hypothetical protein